MLGRRLLGNGVIHLRLLNSPALPSTVVLGLLVGIGATQNTALVSGSTWSNIGTTASFLAIVACGEGLVLIAGGIDLSVGATFAAGGMTAGSLAQSGYPPALCIFGGTLAGLGIGAVNGTLIGYLGLSPIITTLAVLFALGGIVSTISGGYSIGPLSSSFSAIGSGTTAHIPNLVFFALIIALAAYVILDHTAIGMLLRGIGGSRDAVVSLGLPVQRIVALTYVASGGLAALAGVLQSANLDSASPASGSDLEFSAIASVIVGGVSVYGALGSVTGIVVGAVLISALSIVLVILHISGTMQPVFVGLILIAAVALDALRRRRMFRLRVQNHRDSVPAHNPTIDSNITAERPKDQSDE